MAKKPMRTWGLVFIVGSPLAGIAVAAMLISFATLVDVAASAGLPFPGAFPVVVDLGMIGSMIVASQLRIRGLGGRWLANLMFAGLAFVSVVANASHSAVSADLDRMPLWAAACLGAVSPATLLGLTHLVMYLVPDEKERAKLHQMRERAEAMSRRQAPTGGVPAVTAETTEVVAVPSSTTNAGMSDQPSAPAPVPLRLVNTDNFDGGDEKVLHLVLDYVSREGKRPTGKIVGDWLGGKTPKTGQRFLKKMEDDGAFEIPVAAPDSVTNDPDFTELSNVVGDSYRS